MLLSDEVWLELSLEAVSVEFHLVRKVLNIHKFIKFVNIISLVEETEI